MRFFSRLLFSLENMEIKNTLSRMGNLGTPFSLVLSDKMIVLSKFWKSPAKIFRTKCGNPDLWKVCVCSSVA